MDRPRALVPYLRVALVRHRGRLLAITILLALAVLGVKGWRLYVLAQALRADARALEVAAKPDAPALASLGQLLAKTHDDALALQAEAAPLFPIARRLGWVPVYGPNLAAAEPLLDLAVGLSGAADDSFAALAPLILDRDPALPIGVALATRLTAARPQLESARGSLARALEAWQRIPVDRLAAPLRDPLRRVEPLLAPAQDGIDLALAAPNLLGAHDRRDYLLIAQNPDELRATGGLITGAGTLTLEAGRLTAFSIGDSVAVDNLAASPYPDPPEPLLHYMGIQLWVFRDSNWSPDFPTSARAAMNLYQRGQGRAVTGAIAFDPTAVQLLLAAIGPVSVEGIPEPISATNVIPYMRNVILYTRGNGNPPDAAPWWLQRKAFMGPLAQAMLARIESDPAGSNLLALAQAFRRALDERHILIYVQQPDAAAVFARSGWDGAVRPGTNDFLMVVDSNMGYNKVNSNIHEEATYLVDLSDPAAPSALLTIKHSHRLHNPVVCDQKQGFETIIAIRRYEELMTGCYWDYLRVLIPGSSRLVAATVQPIPGEWLLSGVGDDGAARLSAGEPGTSVLSTFLVLQPGAERQTIFRYRLPATVLTQDAQGWHYHLILQKQAGIDTLPISVNVALPPTATLISASSTPAVRVDQTLSFNFALTQDQRLDLNFRLP
jgi:hypothetical protein